MILQKLRFFSISALVVFLSFAAFAQGSESFSDPNVAYTFDLPDAKWKMTAKPSATNPNVGYVYGDRIDGLLEVRALSVNKDTLLTDLIQDEETKLRFKPGFVAGREENFTGKLRGSIYNFEYVTAGKSMSGRFYFLRAGDTIVYTLRFTGLKDSLRSIRAQTDSIARSFTVKK